ncbi:MAG: GNAT family N-acetyltransferase [Marmoricola sp.]
MDEIEFSTALERVDRDWLWGELATKVYWGKHRDRVMFERQLEMSWRIVGAYRTSDGSMVGFCRAFSDGVGMAYLADVYLTEELRGSGIGQRLIHAMIEDGPGRDFRWLLHTGDAHGLYEKFGFGGPDATFMERPSRMPALRD